MNAPIEMSEIEVRVDDELHASINALAQQCALTPDQMASALVVLAFHRHPAQMQPIQSEPIGWVTDESLRRLQRGGNKSRGTVPMHKSRSNAAKHPLYRAQQ